MENKETQSDTTVKGQMESSPRPTKPKSFRITPKGWLGVKTGLLNVDPLWNELIEFVSKQADANGMTDGVPCLVLADGGHCVRVHKESPSVPDAPDSSSASS